MDTNTDKCRDRRRNSDFGSDELECLKTVYRLRVDLENLSGKLDRYDLGFQVIEQRQSEVKEDIHSMKIDIYQKLGDLKQELFDCRTELNKRLIYFLTATVGALVSAVGVLAGYIVLK